MFVTRDDLQVVNASCRVPCQVSDPPRSVAGPSQRNNGDDTEVCHHVNADIYSHYTCCHTATV